MGEYIAEVCATQRGQMALLYKSRIYPGRCYIFTKYKQLKNNITSYRCSGCCYIYKKRGGTIRQVKAKMNAENIPVFIEDPEGYEHPCEPKMT